MWKAAIRSGKRDEAAIWLRQRQPAARDLSLVRSLHPTQASPCGPSSMTAFAREIAGKRSVTSIEPFWPPRRSPEVRDQFFAGTFESARIERTTRVGLPIGDVYLESVTRAAREDWPIRRRQRLAIRSSSWTNVSHVASIGYPQVTTSGGWSPHCASARYNRYASQSASASGTCVSADRFCQMAGKC